MSELDPQQAAPPVGEEIHMPASSIIPLINAAALAIAIVAITLSWTIVAVAGAVFLATTIKWVPTCAATSPSSRSSTTTERPDQAFGLPGSLTRECDNASLQRKFPNRTTGARARPARRVRRHVHEEGPINV